VEASKAKNEIIYHTAPVPTVTTGKPEYIYPGGGKYYPAGLLIPATCQAAQKDDNGVIVVPAIACPGAGTPYTGDLGISWRMVDTGRRTERVINDMDRLLLAAEGAVAGWDYKTGLLSTRSTAVDTYIDGYVSDPLLRQVLATGNVNPWGPQDAAGQKLLDSAKILQDVRNSKTASDTFDIHGSRELMQLGGGALAVAIGLDARRETYHDGYQPIFSTGNIVGGSGDQQPVSGSRNVRALFAELNAPITKTLEASLAVRTDHYSDVGSSTTPKASLRWQPTKEMLFRGSVGKGFRAPTLDDLYAPQSGTNSGSNYDDPFYLAKNGQGACPTGGGSILNCQIQVTVHQGGNPDLKPETSKSYTLGMVFEPTKNITASVDYYHIELKNAVNFLDGDTIFSDWIAHAVYSGKSVSSTSVFASRVHPDPVSGDLRSDGAGYVQAGWVNLGQIQTSGLDFSVKGRFATEYGTFSPSWEATYRLSDKQKLFNTDPLVSVLGQYALSGPSIRMKQSISLNWERGPWSATGTFYWQGGYQDQDDGDGAPLRQVGTYETIDVQASYTGVKNLTLTAGIRNLLDRIPPLSNQGDYFQVGFDPTYSDVKLRTLYLRASYKF
jgi:iron complex outermembrane receptor protein